MGKLTTVFPVLALVAFSSCAARAQQARPTSPARLDEATIQELLTTHNAIRAERRLQPLKWSERLETAAREWAVHLASIGRLEHDYTRRVGQNLFASWGASRRASFVVGQWVSESKDYDERRFECASGATCGHFTQIIWRDTREIGCGVARRGNGEYWVCYYTPPGNIVGERPY